MSKSIVGLLKLVAVPCVVLAGCTANIKVATDQHQLGNFSEAATQIETVAPTVEVDGKVKDLKGVEPRDELYVGLEKAKMLGDSGEYAHSIKIFDYVDDEAEFMRENNSAFLENPFNVAKWDTKELAEDLGKLVVGADQTTYVLQPFELILGEAYASLNSLLHGQAGSAAYARRAVRVQQLEREDRARAGYDTVQPPIAKMDRLIGKGLPVGSSTQFSVGGVFSLGDFTGARASMKAVIDQARSKRALDPRVAFATVVEWAAFMAEGGPAEVNEAVNQIKASAEAPKLVARLGEFSKDRKKEFVLVLIDAGSGPSRGFFEVRIPIVVPSLGSANFRGVYPVLKFRSDGCPTKISVGTDAGVVDAELLDSIDAISAEDFQRRESELWWTPTARAVIRTVAQIVAQATEDKDSSLGKWIALGVAIMGEAEQPDLRVWSTLPSLQYAVAVPRPSAGTLKVNLGSATETKELEVLLPAGSSIVYVRALTPSRSRAAVAPL
ncbi:MAG: hypothetical protein EXS01_05050 [Phycisphaerales bacterium]|nr:hypothetical protein [Phycisphaerales bacterium]